MLGSVPDFAGLQDLVFLFTDDIRQIHAHGYDQLAHSVVKFAGDTPTFFILRFAIIFR